MKTKVTTLALCIIMPLSILAQCTDGFFSYNYSKRNGNASCFYYTEEFSFQGMNTVVDAPLTDALLLLITLGLLYAVVRRKAVV